MAKKMKFDCKRLKNIVGNVEYDGYRYFLLFQQSFQSACFSGSWEVGILCEMIKYCKTSVAGRD